MRRAHALYVASFLGHAVACGSWWLGGGLPAWACAVLAVAYLGAAAAMLLLPRLLRWEK